jgi:hypothetical protein
VPDQVIAEPYQHGSQQAVASEAQRGGEVEGVAVDNIRSKRGGSDGAAADDKQRHTLEQRFNG